MKRVFLIILAIFPVLLISVYLVQQKQIFKKAAAVSGIPYGPIMFGMNPANDYNSETLAVFSGAKLSLQYTSDPEGVLREAQSRGLKALVTPGYLNPCYYWNSETFEFDIPGYIADIESQIALIAQYYPDTVVGVGILNEPHWINHPTDICYSGVPPKYIYNLIKRVREAFAAQGVTDPNLLIGPNSHPSYIDNSIGFPKYEEPPGGGQLTEAEKKDGTINMLWIYYDAGPVNTLQRAVAEQVVAKQLGVKIIYNANAGIAGNRLPEVGTWHCQQENAAFVTWWSWAVQNQTVPLSSLIPVRKTCDRNIIPTPSPPPSLSLSSGWNKIDWPDISGYKASDIPPKCSIAVAKENFWFTPYVKNFGGVNFNFENGKTYYIKCNQDTVWQL